MTLANLQVLASLITLLIADSVLAVENRVVVKFRENPQISATVVRLRDIVEIISTNGHNVDKWHDISLGPAPRAGQVQSWDSQEVMQHLTLRGIEPSLVRWTGHLSTKLQGVSALPTSVQDSLTPAFVDQRSLESARSNVTAAIREYLNLKSSAPTDWRVEAQIPNQFAKLMQARRNIVSIGGGREPWLGEQQFVLQVKNGSQTQSVTIVAQVQLPPMVVVASGPIRRDQILSAELLEYAPLPKNASEGDYFTDIAAAVGKQLRRSVSSGQAINHEVVGAPIVIQRNDLVELEAIAGAVSVRTSAKSLGTGAVGDLIDIELEDRKRLKGTVISTGLVRISAAAMVTANR